MKATEFILLLNNHKKKLILFILTTVITGTVYQFFWNDFSVLVGIKGADTEKAAELSVDVMEVKKEDRKNIIPVMGTVTYKDKATISSRILGRIEKIHVEQGDRVKEGQLLARIETTQHELQLKSARAELQATRAVYRLSEEKLEKARRDVERQFKAINKAKIDLKDKYVSFKNMEKVLQKKKQLYKVGGVTETELDSLKTSYNNYLSKFLASKKDYEILKVGFRKEDLEKEGVKAPGDKGKKTEMLVKLNTKVEKAEVDAAYNNIKKVLTAIYILKANIEEAYIRSPISGVVAVRNVEIGEMVKEDTNLFVVMNIKDAYVAVNINEKDVSSIKKYQDVSFTVDAVRDKNFEGRVLLISPMLDVQTRTAEIKIITNNSDGILMPGMFARAEITAGILKDIICVRKELLKDVNNNNGYVFIYKDGAVYRKEVEIGRHFEDAYQIKKGLDEGEMIVTSSIKLLSDGMKAVLNKKLSALKGR